MSSSAIDLPFHDRIDAGRALARRLNGWRGREDLLVLALPRGGVPVAAQVAAFLHAPLDVWIVRKLGLPGHEEYAMGAITSGGVVEIDRALVSEAGVSDADVERVLRRQTAELERRERAYRRGRPAPPVRGRTVILVDDGLATGSTMRVSARALRTLGPAAIVAAVPVASKEACAELARHVDACVCVATPEPFRAVGVWYEDFTPTSDAEVVAYLERFGDGHLLGAADSRAGNGGSG
jgi:predicted phosphoribosyltransferase